MRPHKLAIATLLLLLLLGFTIPQGMPGGNEDGGWSQEVGDCWTRYNRGGWGIFVNIVTLGGYAVATGIYCDVKGILAAAGDVIGYLILKWIGFGFQKLISGLLELFQLGLTFNLNLDTYDPLMVTILRLLQPFLYIQIIVATAFLLFCSIDPGQRARAKSMLGKLFIALILIAVSKPLYAGFLGLANSVSIQIFDRLYTLLGSPGAAASGLGLVGLVISGIVIAIIATGIGVSILGWIAAFCLIVVLVIFVRWVMIVLFYIIFPFTIFLYFFEYTRNLGGNLLMKTIMWMAMGPVMAFILAITVLALLNMCTVDMNALIATGQNPTAGGPAPPIGIAVPITSPPGQEMSVGAAVIAKLIAMFLFFGGVLSLVAVPLLMTQLMKWVGGSIAAYGMMGMVGARRKPERWKNFAMIAAGGAMMGQGSRGIVSAATQAAWMNPQAMSGESMWPSWGDVKGAVSGSGKSRGASKSPGFFKSLGGIFRDRSETAGKYWAEGASGASYGMTPQAGAPGGTRESGTGPFAGGTAGGSAASAAAARKGGGMVYSEDVERDEYSKGPTQSMASQMSAFQEFGEATDKSGKPLPAQRDMINVQDSEAAIKSGEITATIFPSLKLRRRVDTAFDGARDVGAGFKAVFFPGAGSRIGGAGQMTRGVGRILWSAAPISPFMPIRMMGRSLYSISPSHIPPFMQPYSFWLGRRMMGLSLRQMYWRGKWDTQMTYYRSRHDDLTGQIGKMEAGSDHETRMQEDQKYANRYKTLINDRSSVEASVTKTLDRMAYTGTTMTGATDFQSFQKHLNLIKKHNPRLHDAYIRSSRAGTEEDKNLKGMAEQWGKREEAFKRFREGQEPTEEDKKFFETADQALQLSGVGEPQIAKLKEDKEGYIREINKCGTQYHQASLMNAIGIKELEKQRIFLKSNPDLIGEKDGKVTRRRYFKLEGELGNAAENKEFLYQTDYVNALLKDGVPYQQAVEKARSLNLRLYRDQGHGVYMSVYDMPYLVNEIRMEDWAERDVDQMGYTFDEPVKITSFRMPMEGRRDGSWQPKQGAEAEKVEHEVEGVSVMTADEYQKRGLQDILGRDGKPLPTEGTNPWVIEGDRILVAKARTWTGSIGGVFDKDGKAVDSDEIKRKVEAGEEIDANRYNIVEHDADGRLGKDKKRTDLTGFRIGKEGNLEAQYRSERHFGELAYTDDRGAVSRVLAASELGNRADVAALAMGVPTAQGIKHMRADDMRGVLMEHDTTLTYQRLQDMDDADVRKKTSEICEAKRKEFNELKKEKVREHKASIAATLAGVASDVKKVRVRDEAGKWQEQEVDDKIREDIQKHTDDYQVRDPNRNRLWRTATDAEIKSDGKLKVHYGEYYNLGLTEENAQDVMAEADHNINFSKQEMEELERKGFTRSDMMALKVRLWQGTQRYNEEHKERPVSLAGVSLMHNPRDINPMLVEVKGDRDEDGRLKEGVTPTARLYVNTAHLEKYRDKYVREGMSKEEREAAVEEGLGEGVSEYLNRMDAHYLPHELGHADTEANLDELKVEFRQAIRRSEGLDERQAKRRYRALERLWGRENLESRLKEFDTDNRNVKDTDESNASLAATDKDVLDLGAGSGELGQNSMLNMARLSAEASARNLKHGQESIEEKFDRQIDESEEKLMLSQLDYRWMKSYFKTMAEERRKKQNA